MSVAREETLGLPRLHGRRSDVDKARSKPARVPTHSLTGTAMINNSGSDVQPMVEAPRSRPDLIHPASPREKDQQTHLMRPKSTPGASRSPAQPHYRSDTHSAAARRPTTSDPAAIRILFADLKHSDGNTNASGNSALGDNLKTLVELQAENESLRHNIRQLHANMLEKMRGANKVVGGGQFRVMTSASGSGGTSSRPVPLSDQPACSKCSSLRGESARLKHELTRVAGKNEELKRYVEVLEQQQVTWCTERDEQRMEIEQLERSVSEGNQAQAIARADRDQLELQIQTLQIELERARAELLENASQKECVYAAANIAVTTLTKDTSVQVLLLRDNSYERDEEAMRRNQQEVELLSRQLDALNTAADAARVALASEREHHRSAEVESEQQVGQLQEVLNERQAIIERLNQDIASLKQKNSFLDEDLVNKDQEIADWKHQHNQFVEEMVADHRVLLANSQRTLDEVVRGLSTANADLKRRCCELEAEKTEHVARIHQLADEITFKSEQIRIYQTRDDSGDNLNLKTSQPIDSKELSRLKDGIMQAESSLQLALTNLSEVQAHADSLQVDVDERDDVIAKLRNSHARALERALDKTLRLCVVAPTVNVHVSKPSSSKKALTSTDVVHCCSSPPHHAIQDVVEKEILPFFTKIMLQPDPSDGSNRYSSEGSGQNSGVPSDAWLQQLLEGMKQQLADRLESVYTSLIPSA